ncbi:thioredoxin family protein [Halobacillus sp. H74]|uniref:thioredoxin family protein n=1 Tax=Halobacillus sp. H74 TaxID=3457436 RepID=UPI003FCCC60C
MQELVPNETVEMIRADRITLTFVQSPFCGTCHLAKKMLSTLEALYEKDIFQEMNASLHPSLMEHFKIKSVPCLLVTREGKVIEKIYAFHSVPFMRDKISNYVE